MNPGERASEHGWTDMELKSSEPSAHLIQVSQPELQRRGHWEFDFKKITNKWGKVHITHQCGRTVVSNRHKKASLHVAKF